MRKNFLLLMMFCSVFTVYSAQGSDDLGNGELKVSKARQKADDKALEDKLCDKPCPEFALTDTNGKLWTNHSIKGKVTLINIWHIYCEPYIKEIAQLNELTEKYPEANFLSVTFNTPQQINEIIIKKHSLFHQLPNAINFISRTGISVTPTSLLIDKTGKVRYVIRSGSEKQLKLLNKKLKELSKEIL
ncbi:TlpA disulfide reductase family protein [uncultured Bacteroides sp.]|uniref:TlpA family protein disulfide reductase n=1 Tax=uncultured Bacteroides sp. TaxID=162156 RepID=UPI002AAB6180|nr:TlpA disulfide reductase family protein [uncultured Bacteroides sp.]